jgi:hypothetical protein
MKSIWMVTGRTESGDEVAAAFSSKPTDAQVDGHFYGSGWDEEYTAVGFICWSVYEVEVLDPNKINKSDIESAAKAMEDN